MPPDWRDRRRADRREQEEDAQRRIVAVECDAHTYSAITHLDELGRAFVRELEEFFVNYHGLSGKKYRIRDVRGLKEAKRRIQTGIKKAHRAAQT